MVRCRTGCKENGGLVGGLLRVNVCRVVGGFNCSGCTGAGVLYLVVFDMIG